MSITRKSHKNKTFASFLALLLGGLGAHRFYLRGAVDKLGLLHLCSVPVAGLVNSLAPDADVFYKVLPVLMSYIAGFLETLIIGLMPDEKFDVRYNAGSGRTSDSTWPLAVLLVITMLLGTTTLIGAMSRLFDLLYTGGAYG
jgi:TM2 domain-containing membrane protein YozV